LASAPFHVLSDEDPKPERPKHRSSGSKTVFRLLICKMGSQKEREIKSPRHTAEGMAPNTLFELKK
jgi:hypothetical protein